jgi:hypothetical protein
MRRLLSTLFLGGIPLLCSCGNDVAMRASAAHTSDGALVPSLEQIASSTVLSSDFTVYTDGHTVINHPAPGFEERRFPTINSFKSAPGCYVACYSRNEAESVYEIDTGIYVMGQLRIPGQYKGRICEPKGLASVDISADDGMREKCTNALTTACKDNGCWTGGDTGGWFGIQ